MLAKYMESSLMGFSLSIYTSCFFGFPFPQSLHGIYPVISALNQSFSSKDTFKSASPVTRSEGDRINPYGLT